MKFLLKFLLASMAFTASLASAQVIARDANGDGVYDSFLDANNGLIWTNGTAFTSKGMTFEEAVTAVGSSTIDGIDTWELPTLEQFGKLYATQGINVTGKTGSMISAPMTLWTSFYWASELVDSDPRKNPVFFPNRLMDNQKVTVSIKNPAAVWAVTPVPEPESYAMLLAGLGVIGVLGRHRRKKSGSDSNYSGRMQCGARARHGV